MSIEQSAPSWVKFLTADQWGRELIHPMSPEKLNDPETYVHHTAGNPSTSISPVAAMLNLQRLSHNKGYATVAYDVVCHYSADRIFTIMEGRGAARSAATKDRNEEGEAICMMGYFHPGSSLSMHPSSQEIEGLAWGIAWMMEKGWSAKDTKILGHRDNPRHPGATACPGDYLYQKLPDIRNKLRLITAPPPIPPPPPTEGDDDVIVGYVKHKNHGAVYRQFSNGTKIWVTDPDELNVHNFVNGEAVKIVAMPNDAWMRATGPIVGEIPPGVDRRGIPLS